MNCEMRVASGRTSGGLTTECGQPATEWLKWHTAECIWYRVEACDKHAALFEMRPVPAE